MGEVELNNNLVIIHAHIITYGGAADQMLTDRIQREIQEMWNEPGGRILIRGIEYRVEFRITASLRKEIQPLEIVSNTDPRNNYFRIEDKAFGNISYVDGLGCNTGFFQADNLYEGSTTAAHEFGHTLGLDHPMYLDIRGHGRPGIMYPRGTLVDPQFQYDPNIEPGLPGGTMHPMYRRVREADILALDIHRLRFTGTRAILGDFTNVYHSPHG